VARYGGGVGVVGPQHVIVTASLGEGAAASGSFLFNGNLTNIVSITNTPTSAATTLRAVPFVPNPNRLPVGSNESFNVTLTVIDDRA